MAKKKFQNSCPCPCIGRRFSVDFDLGRNGTSFNNSIRPAAFLPRLLRNRFLCLFLQRFAVLAFGGRSLINVTNSFLVPYSANDYW